MIAEMHPNDFQHEQSIYESPNGLRIRWLGTAGYEFVSPEGHTLLIDPYFTRVGLGRYLLGKIVPDHEAIARGTGRVDAVLVGHSHFDHVADVPVIAMRSGAHVYGSRSTGNLMQSLGFPPSRFTAFAKDERRTFEVGPFKITAIPSLHSRFAIGSNVPYPGDIPCTCDIHLKGRDYKCGDVFSYLIDYHGFTVYHLGSANLEEDQIPKEAKNVDLLLMCIAARFATERFVQRALKALTPKTLVPMHYDNMWRSAEKPLMLLPRTDFGRLHEDLTQFSRDLPLMTLPLHIRRPETGTP